MKDWLVPFLIMLNKPWVHLFCHVRSRASEKHSRIESKHYPSFIDALFGFSPPTHLLQSTFVDIVDNDCYSSEPRNHWLVVNTDRQSAWSCQFWFPFGQTGQSKCGHSTTQCSFTHSMFDYNSMWVHLGKNKDHQSEWT